jgi:hypothetical protein
MTSEVQKNRSVDTPIEPIIDALKQSEVIRTMKIPKPPAATEAMIGEAEKHQENWARGKGNWYRGKDDLDKKGNNRKWCTNCRTTSHNRVDCWGKKRRHDDDDDDDTKNGRVIIQVYCPYGI